MTFLFVLVFALVGCARPRGDVVELTYQTIETLPEQQAIHRAIVTEFHRTHPQIRVNVVYDTSKFQKLNVQLAGAAAPDVFYYIVDRLPALARRGVVQDLSARFGALETECFPRSVQACRVDGRLMMAPFHFSTDVLFYNRQWFEQANEAFPDDTWDWKRFADVATRLAKARGASFGTLLPRPLLLVQSFGGKLFDQGHCVVNSTEAITALDFYRSLVETGVSPSPVTMAEMEAFDGVNLFRSQKIPLLIGRTYMTTEFDLISSFRWDVAPVPRGSVRWSRLSIGGNCVWSGSKLPEQAWEFVKFYTTHGARIAGATRNAVPALREAAFAAKFPAAMLDALEYSRLDNEWSFEFWDEFNQKAFVETTEAVALGRVSSEEALRSIEQLGTKMLAAR